MDDLSRLAFFRPFPDPALAALAAVARWRNFDAGQTVLEAGEPARDIFFIATGDLRIITRGHAGQEIILNELGPGQFFGEIAAIDGGSRSAGVVALTRCRICVIAAEPFMGFALATPEASHHVMRILAELVREKDARLLELTVLPVRPRLIALLLRMARPHGDGGLVVSPRHDNAGRTWRDPRHRRAERPRTGSLLARGADSHRRSSRQPGRRTADVQHRTGSRLNVGKRQPPQPTSDAYGRLDFGHVANCSNGRGVAQSNAPEGQHRCHKAWRHLEDRAVS